jgi:uncharacterized protein YodC (DUF2158 family)
VLRASINLKEEIMDLKPGDVVMLKSGGHPMTVAEVHDETVACLWMGNEGDLFRETLPLAVLEIAEALSEDEDESEEDEEEEDSDEDEDHDEDEPKKSKTA